MAESQSRYSIVERLTSKKLEIMNSKSKLKENVTSKEQHIGKLQKELEIKPPTNSLLNIKGSRGMALERILNLI